MLRIDYKFINGIIFIRLNGVLTKYSFLKSDINKFISYMGFKYIVFNINNVRLVDGYVINYINNKSLSLNDGILAVCNNKEWLKNKFINKVLFISKESDILKKYKEMIF